MADYQIAVLRGDNSDIILKKKYSYKVECSKNAISQHQNLFLNSDQIRKARMRNKAFFHN